MRSLRGPDGSGPDVRRSPRADRFPKAPLAGAPGHGADVRSIRRSGCAYAVPVTGRRAATGRAPLARGRSGDLPQKSDADEWRPSRRAAGPVVPLPVNGPGTAPSSGHLALPIGSALTVDVPHTAAVADVSPLTG